jgi:hypothetical protein
MLRNMKIRYLAIPLLLVLVCGAIATIVPVIAAATTDSSPSLQLTTSPSQVDSLGSVTIQAQVQQGTPSSTYTITVQVAAPAGAGGPFCQTMNISTNGNGNGQETVAFPGTFLASGCAPAGTGGPSTFQPGTYTVTTSSVPAITAGTVSTTFTVQVPQNVISGLGTDSAQSTPTTTFIPAPGSTAASPLFVSCTGTTTAPTVTTAPYYITQIGSTEFTGVITTNSPGQFKSNVLRDPCSPSATSTFVSDYANFYVLSGVTITLPDGTTVTGGLQIINEGAANSLTTSGTTVGTTVVAHWTITGTGGLQGLTGIGLTQSTTTTVGSSVTSFGDYWVQLTFPYTY